MVPPRRTRRHPPNTTPSPLLADTAGGSHRRQNSRGGTRHPPSVKDTDIAHSSSVSRDTTASVTASFSTTSSPYLDDPDKTSILRGAQILKQQFLERSSVAENETPGFSGSRERMFPTQDDLLHDLLDSQPRPSEKVRNIANVPLTAQDWSDPWNVRRGSAFQIASGGQLRSNNNRGGEASAEEGNFVAELWQVPPEYDLNDHGHPVDRSARREWDHIHEQKEEELIQWPATPTLPKVENAAHWANLSANDPSLFPAPVRGEEKSFVTLAQGPDKEKLDRTMNTTLDEEELATQPDLHVVKLAKSSENDDDGVGDKYTPALTPHQRNPDIDALGKFIDSISLDDQALFDDLTDSKTEETSTLRNALDNSSPEEAEDSLIAGIRDILNRKGQQRDRQQRDQLGFSLREKQHTALQKRAQQRQLSVRAAADQGRKYNQRRVDKPASLHEDFLCGTNCSTWENDVMLRSHKNNMTAVPYEGSCGELEENYPRQKDKRKGKYQQRDKRHSKNSDSKSAYSFTDSYFALNDDDKFNVVSPTSDQYLRLRRTDKAFQHAVNAGSLWQSIVGQHVRFSNEWWQGHHRTAPLGCNGRITAKNKWIYYDRHRIKGDIFLNKFVKRRDSPGCLLLHIVIQDFMTSSPVLDIAIGCFHPNAKSVRPSETPNRRLEDCRDVWMATRSRREDAISVIDPNFLVDQMGEPKETPLGDSRRRISNHNVRAIFGETPPIRTMFATESDIYESLASPEETQNGAADALLRKYLYTF